MKTLNALCLTLMLAVAVPAVAEDELVETYSTAELDQMLAPIALYPDTVLSHVLIAATYPLEIIQAYRWSQDHPDLTGADAVTAVELQDWDPSVKALVAFPEVLRRMNDDLAWTQRLGEAFLLQEEEVIASVQGLRERAYAAGNLNSDEHVEVVRDDNVIVVEPARPEVIYVPYYDTRVVYGSWHWSAYPPVYWSYPTGFHVGLNYWWGHGHRITPSWFYISSFHWSRRHVVVVNHHRHYKRPRPYFRSGRELVRYDGVRRWSHNPRHRRGAGYRARHLNDRYSAPQRYRDSERVVRGARGGQERQQVDFQRPQRAQRRELQRQNAQQVLHQAPGMQNRERQRQQVDFQRPDRVQRQERQRRNAQEVQRQAPAVQRQERQRQNAQQVQRRERQREDAQQVYRQTPTVQRQERQRSPQVQQRAPQVQQRAPRVERRESPAVQQRAPQVQRQAPAVQRQAPPARRAAPARRESRDEPVREREQER